MAHASLDDLYGAEQHAVRFAAPAAPNAIGIDEVEASQANQQLLEQLIQVSEFERGTESAHTRSLDEVREDASRSLGRGGSIIMTGRYANRQRAQRMEMEGRGQDIHFSMFEDPRTGGELADHASAQRFDGKSMAEHASSQRMGQFASQRARYMKEAAAVPQRAVWSSSPPQASQAVVRRDGTEMTIDVADRKSSKMGAVGFGLRAEEGKARVTPMNVSDYRGPGVRASSSRDEETRRMFGLRAQKDDRKAQALSAAAFGIRSDTASSASGWCDFYTWFFIIVMVVAAAAAGWYIFTKWKEHKRQQEEAQARLSGGISFNDAVKKASGAWDSAVKKASAGMQKVSEGARGAFSSARSALSSAQRAVPSPPAPSQQQLAGGNAEHQAALRALDDLIRELSN